MCNCAAGSDRKKQQHVLNDKWMLCATFQIDVGHQ